MIEIEPNPYARMEKAIHYMLAHYKDQPNLELLATQVHLSPFHFQRLFTEWAGVSPKQFIQYLSLNQAKQLLKQPQVSLFDAAHEAGLSGTGRLHDLFIKIEAMTPGEFKKGGEKLQITYQFGVTNFGTILIGSTEKGICYLIFTENQKEGLAKLKHQFPNALLVEDCVPMHEQAFKFLNTNLHDPNGLRLHLKGTPFQLKVWESLLKIAPGSISTYGKIAGIVNEPKAARAVGSAIGSNPVAMLIPCHRVIQSSGALGGYAWGTERKSAMLALEGMHRP